MDLMNKKNSKEFSEKEMLKLERGIDAVVDIVKIRGNHGLNAIRVIEKQIKLD
jgi:hypothetical protein